MRNWIRQINLGLLALSGLAVFIGLASVGCDTPDYEPLIFKKKLRELDEKIESLETQLADASKTNEVPGSSQRELDQLKNQFRKLKSEHDELRLEILAAKKAGDTKAAQLFEELGAIIEKDSETGFVTKLDLTDVRYTNEVLKNLVNCPKLKDLSLYGPSADVETFSIVGQISGLETLSVERAAASPEALDGLKSLPNLKFLQLFRATMTPESLKVIAQFPALEQLRCGQTRVGDDGLVFLKDMVQLRALDLSDCNRVSDKSLEVLANLENLVFLKVYGPQITDEGMTHVAKLKKLRVLGLNDTGVTDEGIAKLVDLNLAEIELFRTRVGDAGVKLISQMPNLRRANLRDTTVSDAAVADLAKAKNLETLDLSECKKPGITDESAASFGKMMGLKKLNLWRTGFSDEGVSSLVDLPKLTWVNLDNTKVTNQGVKTLAGMTQLTWLHIGSNKQINDEAIESLMKLENLKYLNVSFTGISEDGFFDLDDEFAPRGCVLVGQ